MHAVLMCSSTSPRNAAYDGPCRKPQPRSAVALSLSRFPPSGLIHTYSPDLPYITLVLPMPYDPRVVRELVVLILLHFVFLI